MTAILPIFRQVFSEPNLLFLQLQQSQYKADVFKNREIEMEQDQRKANDELKQGRMG